VRKIQLLVLGILMFGVQACAIDAIVSGGVAGGLAGQNHETGNAIIDNLSGDGADLARVPGPSGCPEDVENLLEVVSTVEHKNNLNVGEKMAYDTLMTHARFCDTSIAEREEVRNFSR